MRITGFAINTCHIHARICIYKDNTVMKTRNTHVIMYIKPTYVLVNIYYDVSHINSLYIHIYI